MSKNILDALNWRYAVNSYDTNKKISDDDFRSLLEAFRLAPSSFGVQTWKIVDVKNMELRSKIREAGYGQPKITEADKLLVLCVPTQINEEYVDKVVANAAAARNTTPENLDSYKSMIMGRVNASTNDELVVWAERQLYIALGFLLETAALMEIDASPMEGFSTSQVDEILNLGEMGLKSVALCALGYRSQEDPAAKNQKARFDLDQIYQEI